MCKHILQRCLAINLQGKKAAGASTVNVSHTDVTLCVHYVMMLQSAIRFFGI